MILPSLVITKHAFPYLVAQRGALDDMRGDPQTWSEKYLDVLTSELAAIAPYLPATCDSILDVGGGMGGIDAVLSEHYGGCHVTILDGLRDPPLVDKHGETFSNMWAAAEFLEANGVKSFDFIDANDAHRQAKRRYDLIVSFKAWCFHMPPERHLDLVESACVHDRTVLICDVRREKRDWELTLEGAFGAPRLVFPGIKFNTWSYRP